jgi:hypothetical protein
MGGVAACFPRSGVNELGRDVLNTRGPLRHIHLGNVRLVTSVPPTAEPFQSCKSECKIQSAFHEAKLMFSLQETEDGKFIYRCHSCGWECELVAPDKVTAADQAIACSQTHKCVAEVSGSNTQAPKAS